LTILRRQIGSWDGVPSTRLGRRIRQASYNFPRDADRCPEVCGRFPRSRDQDRDHPRRRAHLHTHWVRDDHWAHRRM